MAASLTAAQVLKRMRAGDLPVHSGKDSREAKFADRAHASHTVMMKLLRDEKVRLPHHANSTTDPWTLVKVATPAEVAAMALRLQAEATAAGWQVGEKVPTGYFAPKPNQFSASRELDGHAVRVDIEVHAGGAFGPSYEGCQVLADTHLRGCSFTRHGIDICTAELDDVDARNTTGDVPDHAYASLAALLNGELARCARSLKAQPVAQPVHGTGMSRSPQWFVQAATDLQGGRTVDVVPHGFGTGYHLRTRSSRFALRAPKALEMALGVAPIYIETFDCD